MELGVDELEDYIADNHRELLVKSVSLAADIVLYYEFDHVSGFSLRRIEREVCDNLVRDELMDSFIQVGLHLLHKGLFYHRS